METKTKVPRTSLLTTLRDVNPFPNLAPSDIITLLQKWGAIY